MKRFFILAAALLLMGAAAILNDNELEPAWQGLATIGMQYGF